MKLLLFRFANPAEMYNMYTNKSNEERDRLKVQFPGFNFEEYMKFFEKININNFNISTYHNNLVNNKKHKKKRKQSSSSSSSSSESSMSKSDSSHVNYFDHKHLKQYKEKEEHMKKLEQAVKKERQYNNPQPVVTDIPQRSDSPSIADNKKENIKKKSQRSRSRSRDRNPTQQRVRLGMRRVNKPGYNNRKYETRFDRRLNADNKQYVQEKHKFISKNSRSSGEYNKPNFNKYDKERFRTRQYGEEGANKFNRFKSKEYIEGNNFSKNKNVKPFIRYNKRSYSPYKKYANRKYSDKSEQNYEGDSKAHKTKQEYQQKNSYTDKVQEPLEVYKESYDHQKNEYNIDNKPEYKPVYNADYKTEDLTENRVEHKTELKLDRRSADNIDFNTENKIEYETEPQNVEHIPDYKTDFKTEHKAEYKTEFKSGFRNDYRNDYKGNYRNDTTKFEYKNNYKPYYKNDYKADYKNNYKPDYKNYNADYKGDFKADFKNYNANYRADYKPDYKNDPRNTNKFDYKDDNKTEHNDYKFDKNINKTEYSKDHKTDFKNDNIADKIQEHSEEKFTYNYNTHKPNNYGYYNKYKQQDKFFESRDNDRRKPSRERSRSRNEGKDFSNTNVSYIKSSITENYVQRSKYLSDDREFRETRNRETKMSNFSDKAPIEEIPIAANNPIPITVQKHEIIAKEVEINTSSYSITKPYKVNNNNLEMSANSNKSEMEEGELKIINESGKKKILLNKERRNPDIKLIKKDNK
jgi:hypothetical protein